MYAQLVDRSGRAMDLPDIAVCNDSEDQLAPRVAANGTQWLVVWEDWKNEDYVAVYCARVDASGHVLDRDGFRLCVDSVDQLTPRVTAGAGNYLVVWDNEGDSSSVNGARVTTGGAVLDPEGVSLVSGSADPEGLVAGFDGSYYCLLWPDSRRPGDVDVYGARVASSGIKVDEFPVVAIPYGQYPYGLARGPGGQMMVVFTGWAGSVNGKEYGVSRAWGKIAPFPGVQEDSLPGAAVVRTLPSVIRGTSPVHQRLTGALLDISGRKVLDLHPGANYVRALAPGVYFVREAQAPFVRKVLILK